MTTTAIIRQVHVTDAGALRIEGAVVGAVEAARISLQFDGRDWPVEQVELHAADEPDGETGFLLSARLPGRLSGLQYLCVTIMDQSGMDQSGMDQSGMDQSGPGQAADPVVLPLHTMAAPTGPEPDGLPPHGRIMIDAPSITATLHVPQGDMVRIDGWAMSGQAARPARMVRAVLDGQELAHAPIDGPRPDLAAALPGRADAGSCGFSLALPTRLIPDGTHSLRLLAVDDSGVGPSTSFAVHARGIPRPVPRQIRPRGTLAPNSSGEAARPSPTSPVAVLVRGHNGSAKFIDLMRKLALGRAEYDLFAVVDETAGRPDLPFEAPIWISEAHCRRLGLTQRHPELLLQCGDFAFYRAIEALPAYDHYVMLDYDVHLMRDDADYIMRIARHLRGAPGNALDLLGFAGAPAHAGWVLYPPAARVFTQVWAMYYPLVALSRRAISHMYCHRLFEAARDPEPAEVINCEPFTRSLLEEAGFRCQDLQDVFPATFDRKLMENSIDNARVMGSVEDIPDGIEIIHPVYTAEEFLFRLQHFVACGDIDLPSARRLLASSRVRGIPAEALRAVDARLRAG